MSEKKFVIETKYIGSMLFSFIKGLDKWHLYKKYKTKSDRDQALNTLRKKSKRWKYRIGKNKT